MGYDYPLAKMQEMIEKVRLDNCNFVFVAEVENKILGVVEVVIKYSIHKDSYLIINCLAVDKHHQGHGVGSSLLSFLNDFAIKNNLGSQLNEHELMNSIKRMDMSLKRNIKYLSITVTKL